MTHIKFRDLQLSDRDKVISMLMDNEVMKFLTPRRALTVSESLDWFQEELKKPSRFVISDSITNEFIGFCGVKEINGVLDFGYFLRSDFWGKGIATQACKLAIEILSKDHNIDVFQVFIADENDASKRVAEKMGWMKRVSAIQGDENGYFYQIVMSP